MHVCPVHPLILNICPFFVLNLCKYSFQADFESTPCFCVWESGIFEIHFNFCLENGGYSTLQHD